MAGWECTVCAREFVSQAARSAHINNSSRHPRCVPCNRGFLDGASKLQHLRSSAVHNYCDPCERDFRSRRALDQHRQSAAVHRGEHSHTHDYDSDSDSSMDSYLRLLPDYNSRHEVASSHESQDSSDSDYDSDHDTRSAPLPNRSLANALRETAELFVRMSFEERSSLPPQGSASRQSTSWLENSDDESSSAGENGSYLDASSEEDSDEEVDSDFLAHSSSLDSDAGVSDTPFSLSSDVLRSTITSGSMFGPSVSNPPQGSSASASRISSSTTATASSSTLAATQTSGSPDAEKCIPKSGAMGNGYLCPLCLEQDGDPALELTSVKCGHVFCTPCISRALEKKGRCPVCRARAKTKDLRRIYLSI